MSSYVNIHNNIPDFSNIRRLRFWHINIFFFSYSSKFLDSADVGMPWSIEMSSKDIPPATFFSLQVKEVTTTSRKQIMELAHNTWPLPFSPHVPHCALWLNANLRVSATT